MFLAQLLGLIYGLLLVGSLIYIFANMPIVRIRRTDERMAKKTGAVEKALDKMNRKTRRRLAKDMAKLGLEKDVANLTK